VSRATASKIHAAAYSGELAASCCAEKTKPTCAGESTAEQRGAVKSSKTENAVTGLARGMDRDTESSCTSSQARMEDPTQKRIASGDALPVIASDIIPACNFLTESEQKKLRRIRKDRRNGFMVSAVDVDFLLEVIGRSSR